MGYVQDIDVNSVDTHQMSPGYVVTFLRWSNRDTFNYHQPETDAIRIIKDLDRVKKDNLDVRKPLVVYNDAIKVDVNNSKKSLNPTTTIILKGGDINYSTAVHPGDFILVNMLTWETDAERVRDKAIALQPINEKDDGFKGVFKIQNVVKHIVTDENSGVKTLTYIVTGAGFTEFGNIIYYNPAISAAFAKEGTLMYQSAIGEEITRAIKSKNDIDSIMKTLFKVLIGLPIKADNKGEINDFGNSQFRVPSTLGNLLGKPSMKYASDMFDYIIGIWTDSKTIRSFDAFQNGFNPGFVRDGADNFFKTTLAGNPIKGNKKIDLGNFNSNTTWSILNGYLNGVINEMYTTYRITPSGKIQPVVIVRQKPFTTPHFKAPTDTPVTRYMKLPRWRINSRLLYDLQTSKNDSFRFNFVQVFTRTVVDASVKAIDQASQIAYKNFVVDEGDIQRNGLRTYIKTANFDFPGEDKPNTRLRAKEWSQLLADWVIDGNLKESGTATFAGIQESISVGDNIEIDGIIYHIENVHHSLHILPSGKKKFRTKIAISYGMDVRSSKDGPVYANMDHTDAYTEGLRDAANEGLLPGTSDTQNIRGRVDGEEVRETRQQSFTPSNLRNKKGDL
jgi:hypothetical protein